MTMEVMNVDKMLNEELVAVSNPDRSEKCVEVENYLKTLGVPKGYVGYQYLLVYILRHLEDMAGRKAVIAHVCKELGEVYHVNPTAIRYHLQVIVAETNKRRVQMGLSEFKLGQLLQICFSQFSSLNT